MLYKKFLIIFIMLILTALTCKSWHAITGGFKTDKILPPLDMRLPIAEVPAKLGEDFLKIFDQEYKFLDKGCQVYVFESADKNYVIKFIRHHKYKPYFWMNFFSFIKPVDLIRQNYAKIKKERIKNNFESYLMSYQELHDLTQVLYVHLGTTDYINKKLLIKSRFGQKSYLDLDTSHFVVQLKGKKLISELLSSYKNKDYNNVKELIDKYLVLLQKRCLKNIRNCDSTGFIRNTALFGDKVIEIDVGGYKKVDYKDKKKGFEYEYMRFAKRLKRWSTKHLPLLEKEVELKSKKILEESLKKID